MERRRGCAALKLAKVESFTGTRRRIRFKSVSRSSADSSLTLPRGPRRARRGHRGWHRGVHRPGTRLLATRNRRTRRHRTMYGTRGVGPSPAVAEVSDYCLPGSVTRGSLPGGIRTRGFSSNDLASRSELTARVVRERRSSR